MPSGGLRPTTERVRAAIFSMLGGHVEGARVLDLYAGSGAMGLEALSRGAAHADLVERSAKACGIIRANIRALGYQDQTRVMRARAESVVGSSTTTSGSADGGLDGGLYQLVLIDPPYDDDPWETVLRALGSGSRLSPDALVVAEHRSGMSLEGAYGQLALKTVRRHGDTSISMFKLGVDG